MKKQEVVNIGRCKGLYGKLILRLKEVEKTYNYIPWSNIYEKLGRGFSVRKQEIREIILVLRDLGLVDVSCAGVKLNFEVRNAKKTL